MVFLQSVKRKKMENIQERALRFICDDFESPLPDLLQQNGVLPLHISRMKLMAGEVFKIVSSIAWDLGCFVPQFPLFKFLDFSLLPFLVLVCKELLWEPTLCGLLADPKFNFLTCVYFKFSFSSKGNLWDSGINISNNYV